MTEKTLSAYVTSLIDGHCICCNSFHGREKKCEDCINVRKSCKACDIAFQWGRFNTMNERLRRMNMSDEELLQILKETIVGVRNRAFCDRRNELKGGACGHCKACRIIAFIDDSTKPHDDETRDG